MRTWTRTTALDSIPQARSTEIWTYREDEHILASFDVDVTVGKPLDVLGLKGTSLQEIRDYAQFLRKTAADLYAPHRSTRKLKSCPCCEADTAYSEEVVVLFDVAYRRCAQCGHVFVGIQPSPEALLEVFANSEEHSGTYTDRTSLETRLVQVVKPKLDWVMRSYYKHTGRDAQSVLDVGAGGGHFVEVARRAGLRAEGYEISKASRQFSAEVFNIDLWPDDYLTASHSPGEFDLITFWGLMEYLPEPRQFLQKAHRQLDPKTGMLAVEVPRYEGISTAIQRECPDTIARHLDPTSHVNCFSDSSLTTILHNTGFRPTAVWYFGMDAYELMAQLALRLDARDGLVQLADLIPGLQGWFDAGRLCDDVIITAVPAE